MGASAGGTSIVRDSVTKRMWQSNGLASGNLEWNGTYPYVPEAGVQYCSGLNLGGYLDWRLPGFKELQSIQDYTRLNPAINTSFFTVSTDGYI